MIFAIIMAGGLGTRLKIEDEKPIFNFLDKPLICYVLSNLKKSLFVDKIFIATSPNTPNTKKFFKSISDVSIINTPGINYLKDLSFILDFFQKTSKDDTLLFINADLPFVSTDLIDYVLNYYIKCGKDSLAIYVPIEIFDNLGIEYSHDFNGLVPAGLNILRSENIIQQQEDLIISRNELAFNLNTLHNVDIAIDFYSFLKNSKK